ncbi:hypothetical protein A3SI_06339 [Nitritalea halalkaliphila LW7]|uniref:Uncharacterized protein n=2 Tax=Nitritalea TaxID=1187887 RepID=I5C6V6_9BACT|nr:hypothetical protein A3SI_06339 [Nitritalea halalkaliphila LW7]
MFYYLVEYPLMKIRFISQLFAVFVALFVISGCSLFQSEEEGPAYMYRFTIDGEERVFRANRDGSIFILEPSNTGNDTRVMVISMFNGRPIEGDRQGNLKESIVIVARSLDPFDVQIPYQMGERVPFGSETVNRLNVIYTDADGKEWFGGLLRRENPTAQDAGSLMLTGFNAEGITGRFEALVFDAEETDRLVESGGDLSTRPSKQITNGEFFLFNVRQQR